MQAGGGDMEDLLAGGAAKALRAKGDVFARARAKVLAPLQPAGTEEGGGAGGEGGGGADKQKQQRGADGQVMEGGKENAPEVSVANWQCCSLGGLLTLTLVS